jgi:hypothetical protein
LRESLSCDSQLTKSLMDNFLLARQSNLTYNCMLIMVSQEVYLGIENMLRINWGKTEYGTTFCVTSDQTHYSVSISIGINISGRVNNNSLNR